MLSLMEYVLIGNLNVDELVDWVFKHFVEIPLASVLLIKSLKISSTSTHWLQSHSFVESIMPKELPNCYTLI